MIALMLDKQHLRPGSAGEDVMQILDDLLGCHATAPSSPYLQLRARMPAFSPERLDRLLDSGRAAKLACMRRTLFIETATIVPLVFAATRELAARGRERFLASNGLTPRRYERIAARVTAELAGRALTARQLRAALGATASLSPVIIVMCDEGRLVRWKGVIGWNTRQPAYRRLQEALPTVRLQSWGENAAVAELVDRYIRRYGPVTESDIAWWTGLRRSAVRAAVASLTNVITAAVEDLEGVFLIDEADVARIQSLAASPAGDVSLLPVLDPYLQGYSDRERCIDPRHHPFVVDRGGNTTSVILISGRVAGVWDFIAEPSPELRLLFFESPAAAVRARVLAAASEVAAFLTGEPAPVIEARHMAPLTQGAAGSFLSPLKVSR